MQNLNTLPSSKSFWFFTTLFYLKNQTSTEFAAQYQPHTALTEEDHGRNCNHNKTKSISSVLSTANSFLLSLLTVFKLDNSYDEQR